MEPEQPVDVLASADRTQCAELALVLESQAIPAAVRFDGRAWILSVEAGYVARAKRELAAYAAEAAARAESRQEPLAAVGTAWPGIAIYAAVLVAMTLVATEMSLGIDWLAEGRMDGGGLRAGDWWRPITALTLHADAAHLLGNLFFGGLFAYSVARYWGGGFGWLAIVVSGALGNVVNGFLSGPDHRSIGASTAVFAALGLLTSYCWRRGFPVWASARERSAPIVAGVGLLAYMGTGGVNTDVGAHLLGFVAGIVGGLLVARYGFPASRRGQYFSAFAAAGLVLGAWAAAL
jgi:membrane associated rhomboid family serine protease